MQKFFTVGDGNSDDVPSYVTCKKILEMEDAMDYTVHTIANIFRKPLVLKKVYVKRDKKSEKKDRNMSQV